MILSVTIMSQGQPTVIQSGITSSYVGCACGASQCRHVELKFWHWRQMICKAIFKTHWTVGLPQISVMFQFCYFDLNFKSLILEFLIFGTHFYRFPFKLSTLYLGLSQNMNTLKAVDFKTALEGLLSNQRRHHAKTKRYSTSTNCIKLSIQIHHGNYRRVTQHPSTRVAKTDVRIIVTVENKQTRMDEPEFFFFFFFLIDQYFALHRDIVNDKQVPSKHDTTRTVISILPLATFHPWLIKLVDCSTLCANLTRVSLLQFFLNSSSNGNWNWYCLNTVFCFIVWEWMTGLTFLMYLLRINQSTLYGTFTVLHFQYSLTCIVTVSLFFWWLVVELNCTGCTTTALKGQISEGLKSFFLSFL